MKQTLLITLASLLFSLSLQSQWVQISQIGTNELRGVKFFNEHTGIIVGQGGIWRSINSGVNWTQVLSGQNLNSLSFPNDITGFAVGDSGKIHKTTDGGLSWFEQVSNTVNNLYGVSFYNLSYGYIVGQNGIIIRTTNSGTIWYQNSNPLTQDLNCVQMVTNNSTAIAVGSSSTEIYCSTANGGTNWIYSLMIPNNSLYSLNHIPGLPGNIVAVGGNGRIRRSTNYGGSWTLITGGGTQTLNEVFFINSTTGYIVGNIGTILKTSNSGINWSSENSNTTFGLQSVYFINPGTGWIVGNIGIVLRTGIPVSVQNNNEVPKEFKLYQNYPNPFNPITIIRYDIIKKSFIKVELFDNTGKFLDVIEHGIKDAGSYYAKFNASKYASGVYYYSIKVGDFTDFRKMVLVK